MKSMQHTAFKQAETLLKRSLKGKVTITRALVIGFLMTGLVSVGGQVVFADHVAAPTATVDAENNVLNATYGGDSVGLGRNASVHKNDAVLGLNAKSANSLIAADGATIEETVSRNVAVGYGASVDAVKSVVIGNEANITPPAASKGLQEVVAIGSRASVSTTFSTAIGTATTVTGAQSTAIGFGSTSSGNQSTSMGVNAAASGASSMALGVQANASGAGSTAIAPTANAQGANSIAIGYTAGTDATGERAVAVGPVAKANGPRAIALGSGSLAQGNRTLAVGNAATTKSEFGVAIGSLATVDKGENNVALGSGAVDKAAVQVSDAAVTAADGGTFTYGATTGYNFAGTASAVVSVGDKDKERQIVNVAPGEISDTSTDAINGSQLYAVAQRVERGWDIVDNDGNTVTYVNPTKKVSFKNGDLTTATVEADGDGNPSVKYDVTTAAPTVNTTAGDAKVGAVTKPTNNGVVTAEDLTNVLTDGGWNTNATGNNIADGANTDRAAIGFGKSVDFAAGKNMEVNRAVDGAGNVTYTYATKKDVQFDKVTVGGKDNQDGTYTGGIVIGNQDTTNADGDTETGNYVSGLDNKTWNPDNITSGRAATEDQLKSVSDAVSQGWDIAGNNGTKVTSVTPGKIVSFKNGNLTTAVVEVDPATGNPAVKYDVTTAAPTVNTTAGDAKMGAVTAPTDNGVVTAEDLANVLTTGGWNTNATGNNIADGANTDRAAIGFGKSVDFAAGKNMEVNRAVDGDGNVTYTYATKKDVQFDKVTVGGTENPADGTYTGGIVIGNQDTTNADGDKETGNYVSGLDNKTWNPDNITSGRAATEDQLKQAIDNVAQGNKTLVTVNENSVTPGSDAYGDAVTSGSLTVKAKEDSKTGQLSYDFKLANAVVIGEAGKDGKNGEAGSIIVKDSDGNETIGINGQDGTIGMNGKDGSSATLGVVKGDPGVNGKDGDTMDRIKYVDSDGAPHQVATLDDGVKYAGDFGDGAAIKLNQTATIVGGAKSEADLVDGNIGVVASQEGDNAKLIVKLNKDLDLSKDGSVTMGDTAINNEGLTIKNDADPAKNVVINGDQISMGGNRIENVAAGENPTDAVNVQQLRDGIAGGRTLVTVNENSIEAGKDAYGKTVTSGNLSVKAKEDSKTGQLSYDFKLANAVVLGEAGKDGKDGEAGSIIVKDSNGKDAVSIAGKDGVGHIGLTGPKGENGKDGVSIDITTDSGKATLDPAVNNPAGETDSADRIIYTDSNNNAHQVATMDDGVKYAGDFGDGAAIKLNQTASIVGNANVKSEADLVDGNIGVVASQDEDNAKLTVKLNKDLDLSENGSVTMGDTAINNEGLTIKNDAAPAKNVVINGDQISMGGNRIENVAAGENPTDAVNVQQLRDSRTLVTVNNNSIEAGKGAYGETVTSGNLFVKAKEDSTTGQLSYDFKLANDVVLGEAGKDGKDGVAGSIIVKNEEGKDTIGINGKDGSITVKGSDGKDAVSISGKDGVGHIGLTGPKGADGKDGASIDISTDKGQATLDSSKNNPANGNNPATADRIIYTSPDGEIKHEVATMDDGLTFKGDKGDVIVKKLNERLDIVGGAKGTLTEDNIGVNPTKDGKLSVQLAKDINLTPDGSVTMGNTVVNNSGLTIKNSTNPDNKVVISGDQISMGGNRIENVDTGVADNDAVNVKQLRDEIGGAVNPLREEMYDVGASAAALGALKPLQYDPLEPTQIMVGYGNYRGSSALAMGVAHYKNESTMFHAGMSWAGGSSHMMANAGITWKVGSRDSETAVADRYRKGPISSAYAMQNEMAAMKAQNAGLKGEVADLKAENEQMKAQIAAMMAKLGL